MKVPIHDKVGIFPKYLRRNAILCPKWKFALTRNETRYVANGINSSNGIRFCKVSFLHRWTKFLSLKKNKKGGILFRIIQSFFGKTYLPSLTNIAECLTCLSDRLSSNCRFRFWFNPSEYFHQKRYSII